MKKGFTITLIAMAFFAFTMGFLSGCSGNQKIDNAVGNKPVQNFSLVIDTEKTLYRKNDDIKFNIELKNQSGEDLEIAYYFLFAPVVPTASNEPVPTEMPPEPFRKEFKNGDIISSTYNLGGYFEDGRHEIKFKASFYLGYGQENKTLHEIISNTVMITVTAF